MRLFTLSLGLGAVLASIAVAAPAAAAPASDAANLRNTVGQSVCQVTTLNKWGIPVAYSTGFLLGDGRFVITDLGAVAQPGVARVQLQFIDSAKDEAWTFGLADPALGLVALRVKTEMPTRTGLPLAPTLPPIESVGNVTAMGWRWGKQLDWVSGRLLRGPTIKEVAKRAQVETPSGVDAFLRMDGPRIETATGSPVIDSSGAVLAVRLDVEMRDAGLALAIPASSLRQSLLSAPPELKALAEVPKPLWPLPILRVKGEPPTLQEVLAGAQSLKQSLVCKVCGGKGKVGRLFRRRVADDEGNCIFCQGAGIAVQEGFYPNLVVWAEQATRGAWAPTLDDRARASIRGAGLEVLKSLATSNVQFRRMFGLALLGEVLRQNAPKPRGLVVFARVRDIVEGPDGRYFILDAGNPPWDAGQAPLRGPARRAAGDDIRPPPGKRQRDADAGTITPQDPSNPAPAAGGGGGSTVAVRAADLLPVKGRKEPPQDSWIVVAGSAISDYKGGDYQGWALLPLEWLPAPLPPKKP